MKNCLGWRRLSIGIIALIYAVLSLWCLERLAIASNFGDTWRGATLSAMMEGTAERPFVYRALVPRAIKQIDQLTPDGLRESATLMLSQIAESEWMSNLAARKPFIAIATTQPELFYKRFIALLLMYGCIIGFMVSMGKIGGLIYPEQRIVVVLLPAIGLLFIPLLTLRLAYIYDGAVLVLSASCYYAAAARKQRWYYLWFVLACINKETALYAVVFYVLCFYGHILNKQVFIHLAFQALIYLTIRGYIVFLFSDNPGIFLRMDYMPQHFEYNGTMISGLIVSALFLLIYRLGAKTRFAKNGAWVIAISLLAYILFGKPGEYRVFFETVPFLTVMIAHSAMTLFNTRKVPRS